jgi:hypothetical protein
MYWVMFQSSARADNAPPAKMMFQIDRRFLNPFPRSILDTKQEIHSRAHKRHINSF